MLFDLGPPFLFNILFMFVVLGIYAALDAFKQHLKEKARKKRW